MNDITDTRTIWLDDLGRDGGYGGEMFVESVGYFGLLAGQS
jgi:hypothetical protein